MTLTGSRLFDPSAISIPLATLSCICEELQALKRIFFNSCKASDSSPYILVKSRNQVIDNNIGSKSNLDSHFSCIKKEILNSNHAEDFVCLCNNLNPGYQSASEADWRFCSIVANFINPRWLYQDQAKILEYIFVNARKNRDKNHRTDYLQKTIGKVLMARNNSNKIRNSFAEKRSLNQNNLNPRIISSSKNKKCKVDKNAIIKICNTMKIFHLGRSIKNFEYSNDVEDNYLKATIPSSLNHIDLRYYIQLLFQYIDAVEQLPDIKLAQTEFLPININLILKNSNSSTGGKSYNHFQASLNKLSDVTLVYNKKITSDGLYRAHKESLLSYKILHQRFRKGVTVNDSNQWRKLAVKMHPIILDISKEATYNYSLFNKNSYNSLSSDKIKLLYYYACCLTFPGGHPVKLSLDNLLSLWPPTNLRQVKQKRKQEMIQLLQDFAALESKLDDLDISLIYLNYEIVGINLKKRKLKVI
uniref:Uncharacterized protein n=1 Tax=Grateloupia filicina TaxID=31455 RepID=A0A2S1FWY3_9FLOR|nr:hypothetical protein Grafi_p221 [Grateloupia filicina]AWD77281.1 hypothetical protein Grafi_p221 [Grateloupia filicina]